MGFFEDIRKAIEVQLKSNWTTTDIAWDNVIYTPIARTAYIKLRISYSSVNQVSGGQTPLFRAYGQVTVEVYVPVETGTNTIRGYADSLTTIFENKAVSDVQFLATYINRIGDIGEYYQLNVITPFYADGALSNAS